MTITLELVATVFSLLVALGGFIWYMATIKADIEFLKKRLDAHLNQDDVVQGKLVAFLKRQGID